VSCVTAQRVFIVVYFVIDSVRRLLGTTSYKVQTVQVLEPDGWARRKELAVNMLIRIAMTASSWPTSFPVMSQPFGRLVW
jgi:hypothetical protein